MTSPVWPPPAPGTRWLLRLPNWVGDAVMVLPAIRALPVQDQPWMGVCHPRVSGVYEATGLFSRILPARGARAPWELGPQLRQHRPDRALVFTRAVSGPLLARMSGAKLRLGRTGGLKGALFSHSLPPASRTQSLWREYLELSLAAGGRAPAAPDFRIQPDSDSHLAAGELLTGLGGAPVALAPGSAYGPAKRWPIERFVALTQSLGERGTPVVVLGGAGERVLAADLGRAGARDLTGKTSLVEAVAVLSQCAALVTNDSGALHLGRAAGVPTVGLFGSSSPRWTGPEPHEGQVLWTQASCSPCFKRRCPLSGEDHMRCMNGIEVEDVLTALDHGGDAK